jgi:hypothetical protein
MVAGMQRTRRSSTVADGSGIIGNEFASRKIVARLE